MAYQILGLIILGIFLVLAVIYVILFYFCLWFVRKRGSIGGKVARFLKDKIRLVNELLEDGRIVEKANYLSLHLDYTVRVEGYYRGKPVVCTANIGAQFNSFNFYIHVRAKLDEEFRTEYPRISEHVLFEKDEWLIYRIIGLYNDLTAIKKIDKGLVRAALEELHRAAGKVEADPRYQDLSKQKQVYDRKSFFDQKSKGL